MSLMSFSTKLAAKQKAILGLLGALTFSTGCESPFLHKNEVNAGFSPGINMDLKRATLEASAKTVVAGSSIGVLLSLRDQNGALWIEKNASVSLLFSGGGSSGTFNHLVDNQDGTYTAVLTGIIAGTPSQVSAVVNGQPVTTALPEVTVVPGPFSLEDSAVTISASRVSAGSFVNLKFTAQDAYGNPVGPSKKGMRISFNYTGTSQGTVGVVTDHQDGTYTAPFLGTIAGGPSSFKAKVEDEDAGSRAPAPSCQVVAGTPGLGSSTLSVSSNDIASGSTATFTLVSKDSYGNPAGSGRTVVFYVSGGTSTGSVTSAVDGGNGVYTAVFTGIKAGTHTTVRAKIDGEDVVTTLPQIKVHAGAPDAQKSVITASASVVASGSSANLFLAVRDLNNNPVDQPGLAIAFSYAGGSSTGSVSSAAYQSGGLYSASFTGILAGTPVAIGATLGGLVAGGGITPSIAVTSGSFSALQSLVTVSAPSVVVNNTVQVRLAAKDANGNSLIVGGLPVSFTYSGGTSTGYFGPVSDAGSGNYIATFTATHSGTPILIHAFVGGTPILSASPSLIVNPAIVSLALSSVSVSNSSIASGSQATLILTVRDGGGNIIKDGSLAIAFSHSGGTSTGNISAAVYNSGPGTYSATFTGMQSGTATNIGATIGAAPLTSSAPSITVVAGPLSLATSLISVPSNTVASGSSLPVSVTLKDANGNTISNSSLTVVLSNQGGSSLGTFGPVTYTGPGVYTASFTGTAAGTPTTMAATVSGQAVSTGPQVTVIPGPFSLARSVVTAAPTEILSGEQAVLTLVAKDAFGNNLNAGGLTVSFGQSLSSVGIIGDTVDLGNGSYTASFTGALVGGPDLISASINGGLVTSASPGITVSVGAISLGHSLITVSAASVISGQQATLKLSIKDAAGNSIKQSGLDIVFTQAGGSSTGSISAAEYDSTSGEYSAVFTGVLAGTPTSIGATLGGSPVTSVLPTISVVAGPLSLAATPISIPVNTVSAGSGVAVTLIPKDAAGNIIINNNLVIVFIYQGGTSQGEYGPVSYVNGNYVSTFTGTIAGTPTTLGASIDGNPVTSSGPGLTVTSGSISLAQSSVSVTSSSIVSGSSATVTLSPKDAYGNPVIASGLNVVFSQSGGTSTGSYGPVTFDAATGLYSSIFTGQTAGTSIVLGASIGSDAVSSAGPSVVVVPGAPSLSQSILSVSPGSINSGSTSTVTLSLKDANGNAVAQSGLSIVLSHSGGTSTGSFSAVSYSDGVYSGTFTGILAGTATQIGATIDGSAITSSLPSITVSPSSYSLAQSTLSVSPSSIASGSSSTITLSLKDANGNPVDQSGLSVVLSHSGGTSTGSFSAVSYSNGVYSGTFTGVLAGTATQISATIAGSAITSSLPSITVVPGVLSLAGSTISVSAPSVVSGGTVTLTLSLKDSAGNAIGSAGNGLTVLFSATGGTSSGSIAAVQNSGSGIYTAVFTGVGAGTALNIGATVGDSAVSSAQPSLTVVPGSFSLAQSLVSVSAGTVASGGQATVTLTVRDANQNQLASGGLDVAFTQSISGLGQFGSVVDSGNGIYTATFTGIVVGGPDQISATINGSALSSTPASVSVIPGAVSLANSTFGGTGTVVVGSSVVLTVTLKDANGNILTAGGATVTFAKLSGVSAGTFSATTDNQNGTYSVTFTGTTSGSAAVLQALVGGNALASTLSMTVTAALGSGVNLEVPIEMTDSPIASKSSSFTYNLSRTSLDTNYYDGSPVYSFEIVAKNSTSSAKSVRIVNSSGTVLKTLSVPANTTARRIRDTFTPTSGANDYRISLDGASSNGLVVNTARIVITQTGATKTRIYYPLTANERAKESRRSCHWIDYTNSPNYGHGSSSDAYLFWKKDLAKLSTLAASNPWTFEAILWKDHGWEDNTDEDAGDIASTGDYTCSASLFNTSTNTQIGASEVGTGSGDPALLSAAFSNSASGFSDQSTYEVRVKGATGVDGRCYVGKTGLWVTLNPLSKGEVFYRIQKGYWGNGNMGVDETSRILFDLSKFPSGAQAYYETSARISTNTNLSVEAYDHGTLDVGTSSAHSVSCGVNSWDLSTSWTRYRSASCTSLVNGDRIVSGLNHTSGSVFTGSSFVVVDF